MNDIKNKWYHLSRSIKSYYQQLIGYKYPHYLTKTAILKIKVENSYSCFICPVSFGMDIDDHERIF